MAPMYNAVSPSVGQCCGIIFHAMSEPSDLMKSLMRSNALCTFVADVFNVFK